MQKKGNDQVKKPTEWEKTNCHQQQKKQAMSVTNEQMTWIDAS